MVATGAGNGRKEGDLSWTNEALPLELRRALLDKALDDLRRARASGSHRPSLVPTPERAGQSGSGRSSTPKKDKPRA